MNDASLESLAARVAELERRLADHERASTPKDWRRTVGMFADSEFAKLADDEARKIREADRALAQQEPAE